MANVLEKCAIVMYGCTVSERNVQ